MADQLPIAVVAHRKATGSGVVPIGNNASFVCPHCGAFAQHGWGYVVNVVWYEKATIAQTRQYGPNPRLSVALCAVCSMETVFANGAVIFPRSALGPPPNADMPADVAVDYNEARLIYTQSPRGAAALLRLAIQKLCVDLGSSKTDINAAIGDLVQRSVIPPLLQKALDAVRVIGNEAVHPGTMDLRDDTATALSLFGLVNFIVEKGISDPAQIQKIYAGLPANKLAGIEQRDAPKPD